MEITTAVHSPNWQSAPSGDEPVAVLLHGYGSHEHDLAGLSPWLPEAMQWISPRAPMAMPGMGFAWFPLQLPAPPPQAAVEKATEALWVWLDETVGTDARLVPVGFSQGGLMAMQLLRTRPERIAATVVLAGLMTPAAQPADARLSDLLPAVFWGRGDADAVLPPEGVATLAAFLPDHSTLTERVYSGLGHSIDERVMDDVRDFLTAHVPSGGSHNV